MIQKQNLNINFAKGLDTKTDSWQVAPDNFLVLKNQVFTTGDRLTKRNGFQTLTTLPNNSSSYLTTLNDNLTTIGDSIYAYNAPSSTWVTKGSIQPMEVSTLPIIRNNINQNQCDSVVSASGLVCTAYTEINNGTSDYQYVIASSVTGQNIVAPTAIPAGAGAVSGSPRTFLLGNYFVIVYTNTISAVTHLQYIAISITNPATVTANQDIASVYVATTTLSWDGVVVGDNLFIAYNTTTGGQAIKITYLPKASAALGGSPASPVTFAGYKATHMSVCADTTGPNPQIYANFYSTSSSTGYSVAVNQFLAVTMLPIEIIASGTITNLTSAAQKGTCTVFYEVSHFYSYDANVPSNFINSVSVTPAGNPVSFYSVFSNGDGTITASSATGLVNGMYLTDQTTPGNLAANTTFTHVTTTLTLSANATGNSASSPGDVLLAQAVTLSSVTTIIRSVGLASKAFIVGGTIYFLSEYLSSYQPTYFLINGSLSTSASPVISGKLAYENGGTVAISSSTLGYLPLGLPSVTVLNGNVASVPYLFKDLIAAVNKGTSLPSGTQTAGIYSQTGINLGFFTIGTEYIDTSEIGNDLLISGGFLWMYDGYLPVEQNFFVWPDNVEASATATTGGFLSAQIYFYQVTYEWTDNQGNAYRSAPSIPIEKDISASMTSTNTITLKIPTLRLTYKTANPVKIVIYRWSTAQPVYYQVTSLTAPTLNDTTIDSVSYTDTLADATILGNNIIYTNGGVVEDVNAPASNVMTLFDTRLWLLDAEDPNLWWYSKQVIEHTPVEMSDLLTYYIPPNTGAQGSLGPITAGAPMDDKLISFHASGIVYINGSGPDNTGANSQYSQPIFITSTVGCKNQRSIVLTPNGLMFQSDGKGIWLLGRDLSTQYIGAAVEAFNGSIVQSAVNIQTENQVRFTLDTGEMLVYDYFYNQWSTFVGAPAISSCVYQGLHTILNATGQVYQESVGTYLDGTNPVLIGLTSAWFNLAGLQGYQRAFFFYLLGQYISPHMLQLSIAYDYNPAPSQTSLILPTNFAGFLGGTDAESTAGTNPDNPLGQTLFYGGTQYGALEQWRIFLTRQRCQSFQISIQEIYDSSFGVPPGEGLTLSGINLVFGIKKGFKPIGNVHTVGGGTA